jgi:hypothetical protein
MKAAILRAAGTLLLVTIWSPVAYAQASSTAPLSGAVVDPSGAAIVNATVTVKNDATGAEFQTTTADNGTYTVPALSVGTYTVTITARGFKQAVVQEVRIEASTPATVNVTLEVGAQTESVVVQGGAEVLQTQSANINTTITGRQITELPFTSRDALDLVLNLPGTATPGRPRTSSVNGLPKGSLNISMDGVNVQDNLLKSSDGFFTYIRPRIDAVEEVSVSTATPGAESASEGAVQIKFSTRGGGNEFHGSLYEYHRNPALNANYWFNNRDNRPLPGFTTAPRDRILLNQYGGRVGGPISIPGLFSGKDRAFFFVNYEEFRLPEQVTRQRLILTPDAQRGIYNGQGIQPIDLLALAAANGHTSTIDPTIAKLLADIRASTSRGGVSPFAPNQQLFTFTNTGGQVRRFPTIRLDFNLSDKHHLENIYNYNKFDSVVDFLNGVDPAFPGFPNKGSQISNRFSNVIALRSTFTNSLVNEARFGLTGGTILFFPEVNRGQFDNQAGFSLGLGPAGINGATVTTFTGRRNTPVWQFNDNITWTRGAHSINIGFNYTQVNYWGSNFNGGVVPGITLGFDAADPAVGMFTVARFGSEANALEAANLYAVLTGRVTGINAFSYLGENGQYSYLGPYVERARQRETGIFVQDTWRARPNLTLTGGLRWEVQFPYTVQSKTYSSTTRAGVFGVSGEGNLFKPGTLSGTATRFTQTPLDTHVYNPDYNNFAPSLGLSWSPNWTNNLLKRVFGEGGQTVLRGGYSIAFNREGMNVLSNVLGSNPGGFINATRSIGLGNLTAGTLLRGGNLGPPTGLPTAPTYPLAGAVTDSARAFDPNLQLGYVQSYSFGIQRELGRDTAVEVRYVGNHGTKLWRQYNINEINVVENGFLNEFRLAQANLLANIAAGRGNSFAYFGPNTGTSPLPISLAYLRGLPASAAGVTTNYTASLFTNPAFVNPLAVGNPSPQGLAANYNAAAVRRANAINAGLPANFLLVNPDKLGGAVLVDNGGATSYNSLQIELRRRLSRGLLVQGSYVFSKGLTNEYGSASNVFYNYVSLRDTGLNRTISPFNITHAFKVNWLFELPFGRGKALLGNVGRGADLLVGGWEFHGIARLQSGSPVNLGNVQLVGMTRNELQDAVKIRKGERAVFFLPDDIILNTRRAFNVGLTGPGSLGAPTGRHIAPASNASCLQAYAGQCGFSNVVIHGPRFTRFDLSAIKRFKISERMNFELRAEFLNAFNNINFMIQNPAVDAGTLGAFGAATFGQTTNAYRDLSTTNDPGGRMIQFVGRFNF